MRKRTKWLGRSGTEALRPIFFRDVESEDEQMIIHIKRQRPSSEGHSKSLRDHWPEILLLFPALAVLIGICYQSAYYSRLNVPLGLSQLSSEGSLFAGTITLFTIAILLACIPSFLLLLELFNELEWVHRLSSYLRRQVLSETTKKRRFYGQMFSLIGAAAVALGVLSWTRIGAHFGDSQAQRFLTGRCPYAAIQTAAAELPINACLVTSTDKGEWVIPVDEKLKLMARAVFMPQSQIISISVLGELASIREQRKKAAVVVPVSAGSAPNGMK